MTARWNSRQKSLAIILMMIFGYDRNVNVSFNLNGFDILEIKCDIKRQPWWNFSVNTITHFSLLIISYYENCNKLCLMMLITCAFYCFIHTAWMQWLLYAVTYMLKCCIFHLYQSCSETFYRTYTSLAWKCKHFTCTSLAWKC